MDKEVKMKFKFGLFVVSAVILLLIVHEPTWANFESFLVDWLEADTTLDRSTLAGLPVFVLGMLVVHTIVEDEVL